jgi:hypothetical protein
MASVNATRPVNFGPSAFLAPEFMTQGNRWFVRPRTGSDGRDGKTMESAFATLQKAHSVAVEDQNDVIFHVAEGNGAGETTARVLTADAAAFAWNKDLVHLIGINSGSPFSQRSRIAFEDDFTAADNLFTVSANGCLFKDISFFAGVADANPTGCLLVSGHRNVFKNCHIAGIGHNDNDIAGAYSLKLNASTCQENLFDDCTIGLDTIARGTGANSGLLCDGGVARNEFRDCRFVAFLEHATNHVHVRLADATAIDRTLSFVRCIFRYFSANYATAGTGVMKLTADLTQGYIEVIDSVAYSDAHGTTIKWDVDDRDKILLFNSPTPAADTAGVARAV